MKNYFIIFISNGHGKILLKLLKLILPCQLFSVRLLEILRVYLICSKTQKKYMSLYRELVFLSNSYEHLKRCMSFTIAFVQCFAPLFQDFALCSS